jgi:flagellar basal body-associated protein FliL
MTLRLEHAMTDENPLKLTSEEQARDRSEQRMMWIFSGAIVLLILGAMGANMLFHKEKPADSDNTDISAQSRTAPEK